MSESFIAPFANFLDAWLAALVAASVGGAVVVVLFAGLVRWLRPEPTVAAWWWRLALAKFPLAPALPALAVVVPLASPDWCPSRSPSKAAISSTESGIAEAERLPTFADHSPDIASAQLLPRPTLNLWQTAAFLLWFAGSAFVAARWIASWHSAMRWRAAAVPVGDDEWRRLLAELVPRDRPALAALADLPGPCLVGIFKPTILLPTDALTLPIGRRRALLRHELAHVRRRDLAWRLAGAISECLFWFHPAVWWAAREQRMAAEFACDAAALADESVSKRDFAAWLVDVATGESAGPAVAGALAGSVERRLRAMGRRQRSMNGRLGAALALVAAAVCLPTWRLAWAALPEEAKPAANAAKPQATKAANDQPKKADDPWAGPQRQRKPNLPPTRLSRKRRKRLTINRKRRMTRGPVRSVWLASSSAPTTNRCPTPA